MMSATDYDPGDPPVDDEATLKALHDRLLRELLLAVRMGERERADELEDQAFALARALDLVVFGRSK